MAPRIPPGTPHEIGAVNALIARVLGSVAGTGPPNVFTTLARHRGLFRKWLVFAGGLMPGGTLPRIDTELLILRVAHLAGSDYEWQHHEALGRRVGLSDREIAAARTGPAAEGISRRQAALLRAADELHAHRRVGDAAYAELAEHLDAVGIIELCLLVGHYEMLAMTLNTLGVEPDARTR